MQIKKVENKVELNVSAQCCCHDCYYWKTWSQHAYGRLGWRSGCKLVSNARWSSRW
jgi:hypothetical protein